MGEQEIPYRADPGPFETTLKNPMTRRDFVTLGASAAGISLFGGVIGNFDTLREIPDLVFDTYKKYREYTAGRGFHNVDAERWHELQFAPYYSERSLGSTRVNLASPESIPIDVMPPQTVIAKVRGQNDPNVSMPVIEAHINDRRQLVPILQSAENDATYISLGEIDSDELVIVGTDSSRQYLSAVDVELFYCEGNPLFESILRSLPVTGLRKNNVADYEQSGDYNALLNDLPIFTSMVLKEREADGLVMAVFWQGFSAEDSGTPAQKLLQDAGRTYDEDAVLLVTMTPHGKIVETAVQGDRHTIHVTRYDQLVGSIHPDIQVITDNNMVRWKQAVHAKNKTNIVTSFFPEDYWLRGYLPEDRQEMKEHLKRARTIVSLREIYRQATESLTPPGYTGLGWDIRVRSQNQQREFAENALAELGYPIAV